MASSWKQAKKDVVHSVFNQIHFNFTLLQNHSAFTLTQQFPVSTFVCYQSPHTFSCIWRLCFFCKLRQIYLTEKKCSKELLFCSILKLKFFKKFIWNQNDTSDSYSRSQFLSLILIFPRFKYHNTSQTLCSQESAYPFYQIVSKYPFSPCLLPTLICCF